MMIRVSVEQAEPLRGTAASEDEAPVAFEGWMEFLGVVAELLRLPRLDARTPLRGGAAERRGPREGEAGLRRDAPDDQAGDRRLA